MAQTPLGFHLAPKASLVTSLPDVPLSVEQIEEHTRKLPTEKSQTDVIMSKICRDAAGRMRLETDSAIPLGERLVFVELVDPVAGFIAILETGSNIVHRLMLPKTNPPAGFALAWAGISMPGKNRIIEKLGKRMIEGIEYEGTRTRVTSDDQPPTISVDERWVSTELGLTAVAEASNPREHYSAKILSVNRNNPDPKLLIIPPDYTIRDLH